MNKLLNLLSQFSAIWSYTGNTDHYYIVTSLTKSAKGIRRKYFLTRYLEKFKNWNKANMSSGNMKREREGARGISSINGFASPFFPPSHQQEKIQKLVCFSKLWELCVFKWFWKMQKMFYLMSKSCHRIEYFMYFDKRGW